MSFILGTFTGLLVMWFLYLRLQRKLAQADETMQLLQQEKQIVVDFMHNLVESVAAGGDREAIFNRITHAAVMSTGAMSACIFEKTSTDILKGVAVEGLFPPQRKLPKSIEKGKSTRAEYLGKILKAESYKMGEGLIGQVAQSRRAILITDAQRDPRVVQHEDSSLQVRSMIVAPVLFQNELIAVLAVANPADGLAFTDTDFSLVQSLAEQVGLAVHNSDAMQVQIEKSKIDLDLELASNVQGLLLPAKFPRSDTLHFATHYTAAQKIGGDLYDIFPLDEMTIGVAIADVSGKGIAASLLMAICQTNLRHFSKRALSPSKVLSAINAEMSLSMPKNMFITMIYAVFDLESESLTLARAGHEKPLICHTDEHMNRTVIQLNSEGMALGIAPPAIFDRSIRDVEISFTKGDTLLLYTDGVTESVNAMGEEFSSERLINILKSHGEDSVEAISNRIIDGIQKFYGDVGQADDLTLLTVKHA